MKKVTALFAGSILALSAFLVGCGGGNYAYQEYNQPCYANQQPNYLDGDYYIFDCGGGSYRRVRRTYISYAPTVYVPVLTDRDRVTVYRSIPRTSDSGVSRSTSVGSTTTPSSTSSSGGTSTGVTRSTSSSPTSTSPSRSTSSAPSRSTSTGVSRSTSSRK